jgi:putative chitinase
MTPQDLLSVMPTAGSKVQTFAPILTQTTQEFSIDNPERLSAFIAQLAHESGELRYMEEIADGGAYEGRQDLGNVNPGDGKRFKGRGPIQITGRNNYRNCGTALGLDLIQNPELLALPEHGCRAAGWFWNVHQLNVLADERSFFSISRLINGGVNGMDDRIRYWLKARKVFGL